MICIPVTAATQAEALCAIKKSAGLADVLELRMDLILGGKVKELVGAVRGVSSSVKVLVTNRSDDPGRSIAEEERIGVLREGVCSGADFVDVELATSPVWRESLRSLIAEYGDFTRLIVSHHDFRKTPSLKTLTGLLEKSVAAGARVVKIVTYARSPEDNLRVLQLIPYARRRKVDVIACCMGEQGKISRVMAPLLGAFLTFAALEQGAESAAGQLTVREMRQIFRILAGNNPDS
jgi:3-dehydroquinate dehydratase type I